MFGSDWPDRPTTAKVGGDWFHVVESPAAAVIERMETMTSFRDKALGALIALNEDPGCIEAHLFLAQHTDDEDKRFVHLARAVQTGRDLWEPIAAVEEGFAYWGVTATRPYMRAIAALGDWFAEQDDVQTATELYTQLLDMNPVDSQGIRYRLAELEPMAEAVAPRM